MGCKSIREIDVSTNNESGSNDIEILNNIANAGFKNVMLSLRKQNNLISAKQEEKQKEIQEQTNDLSDDELDRVLEDLIRQREARKRKRERDFEM